MVRKSVISNNKSRKLNMIKNRLVYGDVELDIPKDLSFGKHVIDKLREACNKGENVAMINAKTEEKISYGQLLEKIVRIGTGLKLKGFGSGDVVALCSENGSTFLAATLAASTVGATVTLINVKYTKDEMIHVLNISKPRLIFCSEAVLEKKLSILREIPFIEHIVQLSGTTTKPRITPLSALEVLNTDIEDYESEKICTGNDTAFILYSSGTTGLSKGVRLSHQNILHGSAMYKNKNEDNGNILAILPWYHVYGLLTTIQYILCGSLVVYLTLTDLTPEQYLATIEKYQIAEIPAVPPLVHILAKSPLMELGKYNLSSVKRISSAAAPLSADIIINAQKNLPNCKELSQAYGMTETTSTVLKQHDSELKKLGSCGIPLAGVIAKVVDVVTREKLGPHEQGEVCFKSPTLMKGYMNNEEATGAMFDDEGFIKSGDIGYYDHDGCFYIVDRIKEIIKYKGQQVAPGMVENVIMQHAGVAECGVVGSPNEVAGELPTAFVVKKPGTWLTEQELLDFTTPRLSPMSRLRGGIIFIEEIPRNASGKILRRELRNKLIE